MAAKKKLSVKIELLPHARDLALPPPADDVHIVGLALVAAVPADAPVILPPGGRAAIPSGYVITLPGGMEAQIRPHSGLALHHGITVLAAPQTIAASYHGEVHVVLINHGQEPFAIERGRPIALLTFAPVEAVNVEWAQMPEPVPGTAAPPTG